MVELEGDAVETLFAFLEREEKQDKEREKLLEAILTRRFTEVSHNGNISDGSSDGQHMDRLASFSSEIRAFLKSVPPVVRVVSPLLIGEDGYVVSAGVDILEQSDVSKDIFRIFREKRYFAFLRLRDPSLLFIYLRQTKLECSQPFP
jgi:hypothetical protein